MFMLAVIHACTYCVLWLWFSQHWTQCSAELQLAKRSCPSMSHWTTDAWGSFWTPCFRPRWYPSRMSLGSNMSWLSWDFNYVQGKSVWQTLASMSVPICGYAAICRCWLDWSIRAGTCSITFTQVHFCNLLNTLTMLLQTSSNHWSPCGNISHLVSLILPVSCINHVRPSFIYWVSSCTCYWRRYYCGSCSSSFGLFRRFTCCCVPPVFVSKYVGRARMAFI